MPAYVDTRAHIRSGDLLAWSGRSVGARLIRHWTGSEITHIGLAWRAGGRLFTLEALPGIGVQMRLLSHALPCWWLPVRASDWAAAEEYALGELGRGYSWLDAIRAGLGLEPKRFNGAQCAEYVREVYARAGLRWAQRLPALPVALVHEVERTLGAPRTWLNKEKAHA